MKIFKFGGASVKNADGIKNVISVLNKVGYEDILIVISAMGKTTNALELVIENYFQQNDALATSLQEVKDYHLNILNELYDNQENPSFNAFKKHFDDLDYFLKHNKSPNYNFVYDQVISFGELFSSTIFSYYLNHKGLNNNWLDVRDFIKTDNNYREAKVDWDATLNNISKLNKNKEFYITQGFMGSEENNFTTTLGREGSDYTAAIFAYCLDAESVTIWKDVPGVLNADPRYFEKTTLLEQISYRETIELAFYGASVIHPKTLQPLQRKEIPLYVKSFLEPTLNGTAVTKGIDLVPKIPCFIVKKNQLLLSLSAKDFSFMMEDNISYIFGLLHQFKIKVNVMQNSAISFSVCLEDQYGNFNSLLEKLSDAFKVEYAKNLVLYTIRHFDPDAIHSIEKDKEVLLKQVSQETMQLIVKE